MEGLLLKWTNYMSGWQQRWFTLKDGVLSYYRSQEEMNSGCKGSVKLAVCDVIVHTSDPRRFDLILGEQRFYLRALSLADRQRWVVALGSCKAGTPPAEADDLKLKELRDQSITSHQSELRLYHSLIVQQVKELQTNLKENTVPNMERVNDITGTLNAACSTFLSTLNELLSLVQSPTIRYTDHPPPLNVNHSTLKQSLAGHSQPGPVSPELASVAHSLSATHHPMISIPTGGGLYSWFPNDSLPNNLVSTPQTDPSLDKVPRRRSARGPRLCQTCFSLMDFSFEDLQPHLNLAPKDDPNSPELPGDFLSAAEFAKACRSLFSTVMDPFVDTGSAHALQQVQADVLGNLGRLDLAIEVAGDCQQQTESPASMPTSEPNSPPVTCSIGGLIRQDLAHGRTTDSASVYMAILWLARSLNFVRELLHLLFTLPAPGKDATGSPNDDSLSVVATEAYSRCLRSFHSWSLRGVAMIVIKSLPSRSQFLRVLLSPSTASPLEQQPLSQPNFDVSDPEVYAQLGKDARRYSDALGRTLTLIEGLLACLDLDRVFTGSETY